MDQFDVIAITSTVTGSTLLIISRVWFVFVSIYITYYDTFLKQNKSSTYSFFKYLDYLLLQHNYLKYNLKISFNYLYSYKQCTILLKVKIIYSVRLLNNALRVCF